MVIYQPVRLALPGGVPPIQRAPRRHVTVGRLMGYKNVALMLEAFRLLPDHELVVVGNGPMERQLRASAPSNVRFMGRVSDEEVRLQLSQACAFVFAAIEDFGIDPVEVLALGTPVVALARGGVLDYQRHTDNAWLFDEATLAASVQAVRAGAAGWSADVHKRCRRSAQALGPEPFPTESSSWVARCWHDWCSGDTHADGQAQ